MAREISSSRSSIWAMASGAAETWRWAKPVDGERQRADLVVQRMQRQRFGQCVDGLADLLQAHRQRCQAGIGLGAPLRHQAVLKVVPPSIEIVPAAVDRTQAFLTRQHVEAFLHLLQL